MSTDRITFSEFYELLDKETIDEYDCIITCALTKDGFLVGYSNSFSDQDIFVEEYEVYTISEEDIQNIKKNRIWWDKIPKTLYGKLHVLHA